MRALKIVEKKNEIVRWELLEDGIVTISGVFGPFENVLPYYRQAMLKMHFSTLNSSDPPPRPIPRSDCEGTDWERALKRHPLLGLRVAEAE